MKFLIAIIILVAFIAYRMIKFSRKHNEVEIISHDPKHHLADDNGTVSFSGFENLHLAEGELPYFFFLVYKKYTLVGHYIFHEQLDEGSLKGMALQYEVQERLQKDKFVDFEMKISSKEKARFYFLIGLEKDNPFL
jgi:hypothetical protein